MKIEQIKDAYQKRYAEELQKDESITYTLAFETLAKIREICKGRGYTPAYTEQIAPDWAIHKVGRDLITDEEGEVAKYSEYPTKAQWTHLFQAALAFVDLGLVSPDYDLSTTL